MSKDKNLTDKDLEKATGGMTDEEASNFGMEQPLVGDTNLQPGADPDYKKLRDKDRLKKS